MRQKLSELCNIQYGYAFDSTRFTEDSSYPPLVRIRDIKRGYSETYFEGEYPEEYILHAGDLLVGMDGEFNIARWKSRDALLNQRVCKITAKEGTNEEYLRFALSKALKEIENRTSFVTVKHLSAKELNKLELQVPVLLEQCKIADILSKIEQVISLRSMEIQRLDDLIKARFVEMFGDPICNSQGRKQVRFDEVVTLQRGYDLPTSKRVESGQYPIYGSNGIVGYHSVPMAKDGIVTGRSGTIGEVFCIHGDYWPLNTSLFSIDTHGNDIDYLSYLVRYFDLRRFFNGSGVPTLNRNDVHKEMIIDISIKEQKLFTEFAHQVDKSKVVVQKAFDETQMLYDSLLQEYFG